MNFRSTRLAAIGVGAILVSALFAGCGGSDESEPLTKDEFIAQADQICADVNTDGTESEAAFDAAIEANDLPAAGDAIAESSELISDAVEEIEGLDVSEAEQEFVDQFVDLSRQQLEVTEQVSEAMRAEDNAALEDLGTQLEDLSNESDALADEFGMADCGSAGNDA